MEPDSPAIVNDSARRLMTIEAMLKLVHPDGGGMMGSDVVVVLDFILRDMKESMFREMRNASPPSVSEGFKIR